MIEIHNHIKKNSDVFVTGGNFYFKLDAKEKPVLLLATKIRTERPILILNSTINLAIVSQEPKVQPKLNKAGKVDKSAAAISEQLQGLSVI